MTKPTTNVMRANAVVLFAHEELRIVSDPRVRMSARRLRILCHAFCRRHELPRPSIHTISRTIRGLGIDRLKVGGKIWYAGLLERHLAPYLPQVHHPHWRVFDMMDQLDVPQTMNVTQFCYRYGISRSTYYAMQRKGRGPKTMKIGNAIRIHNDAAEAWVRGVEREPIALTA